MDHYTKLREKIVAFTPELLAFIYSDELKDILTALDTASQTAAHRLSAYAPEVLTPEVEEAAARAMCVAVELGPDEIMANDGPRWKYYENTAKAALLAALAKLRGDA